MACYKRFKQFNVKLLVTRTTDLNCQKRNLKLDISYLVRLRQLQSWPLSPTEQSVSYFQLFSGFCTNIIICSLTLFLYREKMVLSLECDRTGEFIFLLCLISIITWMIKSENQLFLMLFVVLLMIPCYISWYIFLFL